MKRKKSTSGVGTHATEEKSQAGGSQVEDKKDRKRKDKKEKSQHTKGSGDKSESKKAQKHKKKKSRSSEDKIAPTPSIQPSTETETKEIEDMPPRQEVQEPPIDDSHQGPNLNLESVNSCMGDDNAKNQETGNVESCNTLTRTTLKT
ncbi:hypothetical protein A2U01_0033022, partial [Trifolium medium]|nr:hypothetical protein [Trifolium medium]